MGLGYAHAFPQLGVLPAVGISEAMANLKNIFPKSTFFDNQRRKKLLYFSRENFLLALTFLENVEIDADYMTL